MAPVRSLLLTAVLLLAAVPAADAATTYRDGEMGVSIRVAESRRTAVVTYENACAPLRARVRIRRGRISRRLRVTCQAAGGASALPAERVTVRAVVYRRRVNGTVDGEPFIAERGGRPATAAERCENRGVELARTDVARVYGYGPRVIACLLASGRQAVIGVVDRDSDEMYSSGNEVSDIALEESFVGYVSDPFDTAADKYGEGGHPSLAPHVTVIDLNGPGTARTRVPTQMADVQALVVHPDGRVAWAGPAPEGMVILTASGNAVSELARGAIDPATLRVAGPGFAWG
jgi:hypothetical protein